jgi:serine/threonine protein kinase, bacterial
MSIAGAVIGVFRRGPGIGLNVVEVFAGYTIVRLLGAGGMGEVYLARRPPQSRREAFTILGNDLSADDDYRRRFIGEADLAAASWHPNILRVNDRGEFNGQLWNSIDFVGGTGAATPPRERYPVGMPAGQVATAIAAIASALDYAHQPHNLPHRDVNLANVLLAEPGAGDEGILLGDFEIARNHIGDANGLTATNMTGPFPYAASEQLMDEPIDGRADQYALAATADPCADQINTFLDTNPAVIISHHLAAAPPAQTNITACKPDPLAASATPAQPQQAPRYAPRPQPPRSDSYQHRRARQIRNRYPQLVCVRSGRAGPAATTRVAWITIQSPSGDGP